MDEEHKDEPEAIEEVKGDVVSASGRIGTITAQTVNLRDGGVGSVQGENVAVTVNNGGIGAVLAKTAQAELASGGIGAVMAQSATVKGSNISLLAALRVEGDARILFDMRAGFVSIVAEYYSTASISSLPALNSRSAPENVGTSSTANTSVSSTWAPNSSAAIAP
jgi:hypothetical protein